MTLTTLSDNQPEWVKRELGLEVYQEFKLGQKILYRNEYVYIIHIQKVENDILFRLMLPNNVSITTSYESIKSNQFTPQEIDFIAHCIWIAENNEELGKGDELLKQSVINKLNKIV